jgi:hypothetical protein
MHKHIRTTAALLGGVAVGTAVVLAGTPNVATGSTHGTMTQVAPPIESMMLDFPWQGGQVERFIDNGKKGITSGDLFIGVGMPILDHATRKKVGTSDAVELILAGRHDGTVTGQTTLRLPGGHIDLDGIIRHTDKPLRWTVTGGTGRYAGVGGQLVLLKENSRRKVEVMRLDLVR